MFLLKFSHMLKNLPRLNHVLLDISASTPLPNIQDINDR